MVGGVNGVATMPRAGGVRRWSKKVTSIAAAVLIGSAALAACDTDDDSTGVVVRVIDGDTLVAHVDGEETTIRLLNVDTPETKDPDQPVQCLGPEATEFLTQRLPAGTEIELEYDQERLDRYDRTLAGVYESESLINAEIAREGLGVPVYFAPNDRFLPEVEKEWQDAEDDGLGLFAAEVECTLTGQLQALASAVDALPATVEGDPADALAGAASAVEDLEAFLVGLDVDGLPGLGNAVMAGALVEPSLTRVREEADDELRRAESAHGTLDELKTAFDEEQERLEQERLEQERLEQERQEREESERQEREEQERQERERQDREEQERQQREQEEREQSAPAPTESSSGGSSSGGSGAGDDSSGGDSSSGSASSSGGGTSSGGALRAAAAPRAGEEAGPARAASPTARRSPMPMTAGTPGSVTECRAGRPSASASDRPPAGPGRRGRIGSGVNGPVSGEVT